MIRHSEKLSVPRKKGILSPQIVHISQIHFWSLTMKTIDGASSFWKQGRKNEFRSEILTMLNKEIAQHKNKTYSEPIGSINQEIL